MRPAPHQPLRLVLRAERAERSLSGIAGGTHEAHRLLAHQASVSRLSQARREIAAGGLSRLPQDRAEAHGKDGHPRHLPEGQSFQAEFQRGHRAVSAAELQSGIPEPGLVDRHHLYPDEAQPHVPYGAHRLAQPEDRRDVPVRHARHGLCHSCCEGSRDDTRPAGHSELRPGKPVHQRRVQATSPRPAHPPEHGWQAPLGGQHHDRALVPQLEGGTAVPQRIRIAARAAPIGQPVRRRIQHHPASRGAGIPHSERGLQWMLLCVSS